MASLSVSMADYRSSTITRITEAIAEINQTTVNMTPPGDALQMVGDFTVRACPAYLSLLSIADFGKLAGEIDRVATRLTTFTFNQKAIARDVASIALNGEAAARSHLVQMLGAMLAMERESSHQRGGQSQADRAKRGAVLDQVRALANGTMTAREIATKIDKPTGQIYSALSTLREQGIDVSVKEGKRGRASVRRR